MLNRRTSMSHEVTEPPLFSVAVLVATTILPSGWIATEALCRVDRCPGRIRREHDLTAAAEGRSRLPFTL